MLGAGRQAWQQVCLSPGLLVGPQVSGGPLDAAAVDACHRWLVWRLARILDPGTRLFWLAHVLAGPQGVRRLGADSIVLGHFGLLHASAAVQEVGAARTPAGEARLPSMWSAVDQLIIAIAANVQEGVYFCWLRSAED